MKRSILVQGAPGVGKSTIAERLSVDLEVPLIAKDGIKEFLYDYIGEPISVEQTKLYGRIAIRSMYVALDEYVKAEQMAMIEAPVESQYAVGDLVAILPLDDILQIHVVCDPGVHAERFRQRALSGERHTGHGDTEIDAAAAQERNNALAGIDTIEVDTTDFSDHDYDELLGQVRRILKEDR